MKNTVENFVPQGGKHCITNSLKQIFTYYGYPMSEELMFGLASGLSFLYLNQAASPMINGRTKVFEFEKKLADRLQITIHCRAGKNYERIFQTTKQMIDAGEPVLVYVDMPFLPYLGLNAQSHFGGHAVVLFGYDEEQHKFLVSDRDQQDASIQTPNGLVAKDYHMVDYEDIKRARSSSFRPFPAQNKYLTFDFQGYRTVDKQILREAILDTCDSMLHPPAQLLGVSGILKFSREINKWKAFHAEKLKLAGITNYFQINERGGTGGGIFRRMYGDFLKEAAGIWQDTRLFELGEQFIAVSFLWDAVAELLWKLSQTKDIRLLEMISQRVLVIYERESSLYHALYALAA